MVTEDAGRQLDIGGTTAMANQQQRQPENYESRGGHNAASWREAPVQAAGGSAERDETYGLVSVLYHAFQGAETYTKYIADAERAGEEEIASFFRECQEQENQRALRAKQLLAMQLEDIEDRDYDEDEEAADEDE
jgi:hypothetical protein